MTPWRTGLTSASPPWKLNAGASLLLVSFLVLLTIGLSPQQPALALTQGGFLGAHWQIAPTYPTPIWGESCVTSGGYVYCVGGMTGNNTATDTTSSVYFAQVTSSGLSGWTQTTSYPTTFRSGACVAHSETIYCMGGYSQSAVLSTVYYAPLSSSGVGAWSQTSSYPIAVWVQSCAASATGVYCVGGNDASQNQLSLVSYAPFTSSGIGQWTNTTSYPQPVREESCVASDSYLYCVGGYASKSDYYAPLAQDGIGEWKQTTTYPVSTAVNSPSCMLSSGVLYCVGGYNGAALSNLVYSVNASSTGLGPFVAMTGYPHVVWQLSCVFTQETIVCVGGASQGGSVLDDVRYLQGSTSSSTSSSASTSLVPASSSTATSSLGSSATSQATSSGGLALSPESAYAVVAVVSVVLLILAGSLAVRGQWRRPTQTL